jgi:ATP-dependent Clp protease ATP-binding subunit ClpA
MDEAGAEVKLKARKSRARVTPKDMENVVARMAKVPMQTVATDEKTRLKNLEVELKAQIYGQDQAIAQVVQSVCLSRAGLKEPDKPVASFLLVGPTGVGKTELAKQLSKVMGIEFLRFDMSEYMEKHTVSRLIGSPPGYVGFDQGGLLTEAIVKTPHCVLLLDEIEKAHEDIFNLLLQVMDHATLTDNNGRKADFRHVILMMTTNTGAADSMVRTIGFEKNEFEDKSLKAVEKTFSPEFRNRLTGIVPFKALNTHTALKIVDTHVAELLGRLTAPAVILVLEDKAREYLAQKGFDAKFGARPIKRLIENEIAEVVSQEILFGKLTGGGKVLVKEAKERLVVSITNP